MGAWEGGPVGPGPLPLGPWGTSQGVPGGGPDPMSAGQKLAYPPWIRIKNHVDFDVDFWSSWGPSWVPLGGHFRSCWRLFRPKLVSEPSSKRLIFQKVMFTKHYVFQWFWAQNDPKMGPRSTQDRSKMGPRSSWVAFFRLEFSLRFLIVLGSILVPF